MVPTSADTAAPASDVEEQAAAPAEELPSQDLLDQELVRILLEPPDYTASRDLMRDLARRLKHPVPPLLLADALIRLAPQQRASRPQDRSFVRSALLQRLQQKTAWTSQPIVQTAPHDREDEEGDLEDGSWVWRFQGFTIVEGETGRRGILHVWLKNDLDEVGVGQPVAVVLCDAAHSYTWSPVSSGQVDAATCPEGCRGSLASVAVEPTSEILGHLSFPLPADAAPEVWGLQMGHHAHMRPLKG